MSAHATRSQRSQRQCLPMGYIRMTPKETIQFKNQLAGQAELQKARQ